MQKPNKKVKPTTLHPRNRHKGRYDFEELCNTFPSLKKFLSINKYGNLSIDFFNPAAVKALNTALIKNQYNLEYWDIPNGFLCPPIPGRADYIHHLADILASINQSVLPKGEGLKGMDIGVGANCIYPIIGHVEYGWSFIGTDIDPIKIKAAEEIVAKNPFLKEVMEFSHQPKSGQVFKQVLFSNEKVDFTMCNPPFHSSQKEAEAGTLRKLSNLKKKRIKKPALNFGGQGGELWTTGGEKRFILNMISESKLFAKQCAWYTTLVSKHSNLDAFYHRLKEIDVFEHCTVLMGQGNKQSRILAWTFLSKTEQRSWVQKRWSNQAIV